MERDILLLHGMLQEGKCCSQALAAMGAKLLEKDSSQLEEAAKGLCLGVRSGLLCGALTGGALCLSQFHAGLAASEMIPELVSWFQETYGEAYGGTDCEAILAGDPTNKAFRCPAIVENVWLKCRELLEDQGFDTDALLEQLPEG